MVIPVAFRGNVRGEGGGNRSDLMVVLSSREEVTVTKKRQDQMHTINTRHSFALVLDQCALAKAKQSSSDYTMNPSSYLMSSALTTINT